MRGELGIALTRPIIAIVGRVQPLKDQELAIRVLAELHALRGSAPVLVVAGEATPGEDGYASTLRSVAAELGVLAEVRFAGALSRERLADLLAIATVTLVPSHSETFGLVALESAASGTPVIAFRGGGLVESVSPGVSGLLVDSRDARAWAQATVSLLDDTAQLQRLSGNARHYAEGFTWAATAAALIGVYASLGGAYFGGQLISTVRVGRRSPAAAARSRSSWGRPAPHARGDRSAPRRRLRSWRRAAAPKHPAQRR